MLILACVFEDYRRLGLEMFAIDPAYYISSPSYSFDAMLHLTNVELELLTDEDMYEFFEKGKFSIVVGNFNFSTIQKHQNHNLLRGDRKF